MIELLDQFLTHKKVFDKLAQSTLDEYTRSVSAYFESSGGVVSRETYERWVLHMQERGLKDTTIAKCCRNFRTFHNWGIEAGLLPEFKVKVPKVDDRAKKRGLSRDQVAILDRWLQRNYPTGYGKGSVVMPAHLQMHIRVYLPMCTAMRISDCLAAQWSDLDMSIPGREKIWNKSQKTGRENWLLLDPLFKGHLPELLNSVPLEWRGGTIIHTTAPRTRAETYHPAGSPLTKPGYDGLVKQMDRDRLEGKLALPFKVTAHTFRHTFGTIAASEGVPPPAVAAQMQHKNWQMLQEYYYDEDVDIQAEAFEKALGNAH